MKKLFVLIAVVLVGCTAVQPKRSKPTQVPLNLMPPIPGQRMMADFGLPTNSIVSANRVRGTNYVAYVPVPTNQMHMLSCSNKVQVLCSTDLINWSYFAMTDSNGISIYPSRTNLFFKAAQLEAKITAGWNLPNNTNIAGYKVYCGGKPGCYDISYYVPGPLTTNVVLTVPVYNTNYFAVTSYATNKESIFSTQTFTVFPRPTLVFK